MNSSQLSPLDYLYSLIELNHCDEVVERFVKSRANLLDNPNTSKYDDSEESLDLFITDPFFETYLLSEILYHPYQLDELKISNNPYELILNKYSELLKSEIYLQKLLHHLEKGVINCRVYIDYVKFYVKLSQTKREEYVNMVKSYGCDHFINEDKRKVILFKLEDKKELTKVNNNIIVLKILKLVCDHKSNISEVFDDLIKLTKLEFSYLIRMATISDKNNNISDAIAFLQLCQRITESFNSNRIIEQQFVIDYGNAIVTKLSLSEDYGLREMIELKLASLTKNNRRVLELSKKRFERLKTKTQFYDIIACLAMFEQWSEIKEMIEKYPNLFDQAMNSTMVKMLINVIVIYQRNNPNCPLNQKINTNYYNVIHKYNAWALQSKFVIQMLTASLSLRDSSDKPICCICLEELEIGQKVGLCKFCDRYIGCVGCVENWLKQSNICPHCNK